MSGNRRGFIGIFAQKDDPTSDDESEDLHRPETEKPVSKAADNPERLPVDEVPDGGAESDWDDIFDEGPSRTAAKPVRSSKEEKPTTPAVEQPVSNDVKAKAPITKDDGTGSNKTHHENESKESSVTPISSTSPTKKSMHQGQSPKSILSASDRQAITDALQTLREKLSFTRQVSAEQRTGLMKLGDTGRSFIGQALKVVNETPDILPRSFDDERFCADVDLAETLRSVAGDLNELSGRVEDTESKICSSAFIGALAVHSCGKLDGKGSQFETYRRNFDGKRDSESAKDTAAAMNGAAL